jgi:transposase
MRGRPDPQTSMLAFLDPESLIPAEHPIRTIKRLADQSLAELDELFTAMYAEEGRPSIPPERLLKASLLIALYSVRSERAFCEQLSYNLLFRWFLDLSLVEAPFDASTFSKNRQRLLAHDVARRFFDRVVRRAGEADLLSSEHFTVDGTLLEACASLKSFRPRDEPPPPAPPDDPGNPTVDFHGEKRSNATHQSRTDPEARLARKGKGKEAKLSFTGHALMENRHGLLVDFRVTQTSGTAERDVVPGLLGRACDRGFRPKTLGADKGYDTKGLVEQLREAGVTPHVARKAKHSALDERTTRHAGYAVSQRVRKRVEEIFGWMKTVGAFRRTRYRGVARTDLAGLLVGAAYNLARLARLLNRAASPSRALAA